MLYTPAVCSTSPGTGYRLTDNAGNLCCDYGLIMELKGVHRQQRDVVPAWFRIKYG